MPGSLTIPNVIAAQAGPTLAASLLDANWNQIRDYLNPREVTLDTLANRPVAGVAGRWYYATDTGLLYVDTGASWTTVSSAARPVFFCRPESATFPTTNFPQLVKNSGTNWTDYTLDYDQTTAEAAFWYFGIPEGLVFSGAEIEIYSRQATLTTGTLGWTVTTLTRSDGQAWDTAGNADTMTAATVKGTAGQVLRQERALTVTGWAAEEVVQVRIARDIADTVAEDGKFILAVIRLT